MNNLDESFFSHDNIELNLDKWGPGKILYITGISGSGKSTLGKELSKEKNVYHIELDFIYNSIKNKGKDWGLNKLDSYYNYYPKYLKDILKDYLNDIDSSIYLINKDNFEITIEQLNAINGFSRYLEENIIGKRDKFIIEGTFIFRDDPEFYRGKPLIIMGTGLVKSNIRAISRVLKRAVSNKRKFNEIFFRLSTILNPNSPQHKCAKMIDNFAKELTRMNNSDNSLAYLFEDVLRKEKPGKLGIGFKNKTATDWLQKKMKETGKSAAELSQSDEFKNIVKNSLHESEELRISDVIDGIKDITYGFISKKDGSRIDNREWIHGCKNLPEYYETNWDPKVTLKNKLGICVDQSLATKYLMNKYHPEIETQLYALYKGRFGHCVFTFKDDGKYFYLENAWDKERSLHGPFNSKEELEDYLNFIYYKNHYKDNNDPVIVKEYHPEQIHEDRGGIFYGINSID